jgi:hypothetical protein
VSAWQSDELARIDAEDELQIAPLRRNGTRRSPVPIWAVRVGDGLYARAAYGAGSVWHRVARTSGEARISAGGVERDVAVEDAEEAVYDQVDAAYRAKYGRYASIVDGITDDQARSTTLKLVPLAR